MNFTCKFFQEVVLLPISNVMCVNGTRFELNASIVTACVCFTLPLISRSPKTIRFFCTPTPPAKLTDALSA